MRALFLSLVFISLNSFAVEFPKQKMKLGKKTLVVEVATTEQQHAQGLMHRKEVPDGTGMLFIFDSEQPMEFWMKNTFVPLTIGFFDKKKKLVETIDMEPVKSEMEQNPPRYKGTKKAMYALEVRQGWFKKNKIDLKTKFKLKPLEEK